MFKGGSTSSPAQSDPRKAQPLPQVLVSYPQPVSIPGASKRADPADIVLNFPSALAMFALPDPPVVQKSAILKEPAVQATPAPRPKLVVAAAPAK